MSCFMIVASYRAIAPWACMMAFPVWRDFSESTHSTFKPASFYFRLS